jgi:hypothetical protein
VLPSTGVDTNHPLKNSIAVIIFGLCLLAAKPAVALDRAEPPYITVYPGGSANQVDFNTYVKDVLPNEWPSGYGWPAEAYKAGAIAVKMFGWYRHEVQPQSSGNFDVYKDTRDQVYVAGSSSSSSAQQYTNPAVAAVRGFGLENTSGQLFLPQYWDGACTVSNSSGAYLREQPTTSSNGVLLANGTRVYVIDNEMSPFRDGHYWCQVSVGGVYPGSSTGTGFIAADLLQGVSIGGNTVSSMRGRLTQYGTVYWANQRWGYDAILNYFYPNTRPFNVVSADTTAPGIINFAVTPSSVSVGNGFTVDYTVSDAGGSGLNRIVLRRTSGDGTANDPGWQDIKTNTASGNGPVSGSFTDAPSSAGAYWYGMAVFDNSGNSRNERQAGLGPVQRTVTTGGYTITTSSSPSNGGTTTGGGTFPAGSSRTVTATANSGYSFVNWTESGSAVSSSASYTFTLNSNRSLVANFSSGPNVPTVQTLDASSVTSSTAVLNGRVVSDGGSPVNDYFFSVWDDPANPVGFGSQYISVSGNNFSLPLQGFTPGVTYFYRAYAHNGTTTNVGAGPGWGFGSVVSFVPGSGAKCDFNKDGNSDLIWQNNSTGQRSIWLMNGTSWDGTYVLLPTIPTEWKIAGTGDFNGDGNVDIVWQNSTTGQRSIWLMNATSWTGTYVLLPTIPTEWEIAGTGDFNGDGKVDLVWQNNSTGQRSIWLMNGTSWDGTYVLLPTIPTEWKIAAVGDFNGDGKVDLLWQNSSTGQRSIWLMNGTSWTGTYVLLPTIPLEWKVAGAGDFSRDGKVDILWQNNSTGQRSIWLMNGTSWDGTYVLLPTIPTEWEIRNH